MSKSKNLLYAAIGFVILAGLLVRLYLISDNQFLFYDEGLYIGYNREFLNLVANNPAHNLNELFIIISLIFKTALAMPKALWFFLLSLRVFFLGPHAWFFARWISAFSGLATVVLLFFWARRYFGSKRIAILSALILLVLPSHVFYSRLGMQEALSTLLFLSGIYLYMQNERMQWPFFVSAFLLSCVYFTNYRMIISPIFIIFIEFYAYITRKKPIDCKKIAVYLFVFFGFVIFVGCLYGGANLHITLAWMFHQAQDADSKFNLINFLSYPYDIFALEGFLFACLFWGNLYLIKSREYSKLLPFGFVLLQMLIFSFAAEKGARYLCVVLPFMAAAAAVFIDDCWQRLLHARGWILTIGALTFITMIYISGSLALARTDYQNAIESITGHDPQAVIVSTQPVVEGLFLTNDKRIIPCPQDAYSLFSLYQQGARYLILDPQAYVSWTANGRRFSPPLVDFLQLTLKEVKPLVSFSHLNKALLNRFVLDHNEQIMDSVDFLSHAGPKGYGRIRVYDLGAVLAALRHVYMQDINLN